MPMRDLRVEKLKPLNGCLVGQPSYSCISIPLEPFDLDGEVIETVIRLDGVSLPTIDVARLAGQSFQFPSNPKLGSSQDCRNRALARPHNRRVGVKAPQIVGKNIQKEIRILFRL